MAPYSVENHGSVSSSSTLDGTRPPPGFAASEQEGAVSREPAVRAQAGNVIGFSPRCGDADRPLVLAVHLDRGSSQRKEARAVRPRGGCLVHLSWSMLLFSYPCSSRCSKRRRFLPQCFCLHPCGVHSDALLCSRIPGISGKMANGGGCNVRELKVSAAAQACVTMPALVATITILGGAPLASAPIRFAPTPLFATHLMPNILCRRGRSNFVPSMPGGRRNVHRLLPPKRSSSLRKYARPKRDM